MNYAGRKLDGRYMVEKMIGEGGMSDVYRGIDLSTDRPVAIKILKEEFNNNEELLRRFMNESRAISVLSHPNIVKVFDVSVNDKVHYIVMELITGITLKEYIEQRGEPLTYKETVHFISQTLRALQHAHDKGIIHRDIKPQNIMILEDGSIKVMDFGIARLARSEIHTDAEQAIGSVHYISPEQAQGAETDLRADIYSTGIMMYEMLSGKLPFEDESAVAIAVKQISDEAVPLKEVNPSVPDGLCDITMRAMAKDPAMRYQSALDMLRDIEEVKQNPSIRFEYEYLAAASPARYINRVMNEQKKAPRSGEALTTKKKKKRKIRKIGFLVPIVLGLTIAIVGVCVLQSYNLLQNSATPFFSTQEELELPNFTGMDYDEVAQMLKRAPYNQLRIEMKEEYNSSVEAGDVVSQTPYSNNDSMRIVKSNQRVTLVVSKGIETVEIPNVSGMSRRDAIRAILDAGLTPYARSEQVEDVTPGYALGTDPEAGTRVQNVDGLVVTILISSNASAAERTVPSLVGVESLEAAQQRLIAADLSLGVVTTVVTAEYAPGTVVEQKPASGTTLAIGGEVHLVIAEAPPVEEEPVEDTGGGVVVPMAPSSSESTPASSAAPPASSETTPPASSETTPPASSSESTPPASSEGGGVVEVRGLIVSVG